MAGALLLGLGICLFSLACALALACLDPPASDAEQGGSGKGTMIGGGGGGGDVEKGGAYGSSGGLRTPKTGQRPRSTPGARGYRGPDRSSSSLVYQPLATRGRTNSGGSGGGGGEWQVVNTSYDGSDGGVNGGGHGGFSCSIPGMTFGFLLLTLHTTVRLQGASLEEKARCAHH